MRSSPPAEAARPVGSRFSGLALPALDALVEGAWLSVIYAGYEVALARHAPVLGPLEFALAAGLGIWLRRRQPPLARRAWLTLLLAVTLVGWLASPDARAALLAGQPTPALGWHLGGLLLGAGLIRGGAHAVPEDDDLVLGGLLRMVLPLLALPWLAGALMPGSVLRTEFLALALAGTILFVSLGFVALGLARLRALGLRLSLRDRDGRAWLGLTTGVPLLIVAVAVPFAYGWGLKLDDFAGILVGPTNFLVSIATFLLFPVLLLFSGLVGLLLERARPIFGTPGGPTGSPGTAADVADLGRPLFLILVVLVAVALVLLVVAEWLRGRRPASQEPPMPVVDVRTIVLPSLRVRPRGVRRSYRPPTPHDAVRAYLAALSLLAADPARARDPVETPAAHARRLASEGFDEPDAGLRHLAADYQLARYGGRAITPRETVRALDRWRAIRARFRR